MFDNADNVIGFVINILSAVCNLIACLISIIVLMCIIIRQYDNRIKRQDRIILILSANIYLYILLFVIIQLILSIYTILGDLYKINFGSSWCIFNGYFISVVLCALYYGFVVQSFFRLCCIVYSSYRWLQFYWFYIIAAPIQLLVGLLLLSPLLVWHEIVYLPNEYYCFILFTHVRSTLSLIIHIYTTPLLFVLFIYIRIIIFIRHQPNNQLLLIKRKQERDLVAIQRIFITVNLLIVMAIPTLVFIVMAYIIHIEHPLSHRITMISFAISMVILSVVTVFVTPQLKASLLKMWQRNRVIPIIDANLMRAVQLRPIDANLMRAVQLRPIDTIR